MAVGRPKKTFTRDQLDEAKRLLGRRQYPSKVAGALTKKFEGLTLARAYKLIEAAQQEVHQQFAQQGADPLAATYLFLQSVIASAAEKTAVKVSASKAIISLLGMGKLIRSMSSEDDIADYLATIHARRAARAGENHAPPARAAQVEGEGAGE